MTAIEFENFKKYLFSLDSSIKDVFALAYEFGPGNIFAAGGVVRDYCLGVEEKANIGDVDLFISKKLSNQFKDLQNLYGRRYLNQFGSSRWYPNKTSFYYDIIEFDDFYQGLWKCADIIDVLNQFDITSNAVAFDLYNGEFYNPVNGVRDAKDGVIRAVRFDFPDIWVSDSIPISRNSVLWFRYNHYSKKLDAQIEPITKSWMMDNSYRIKDIDVYKRFFFNPDIVI